MRDFGEQRWGVNEGYLTLMDRETTIEGAKEISGDQKWKGAA
jgi:hypothetical protein